MLKFLKITILISFSIFNSGCAFLAFADATASVATAAVSVTSNAISTTASVASWSIKKVVSSDENN